MILIRTRRPPPDRRPENSPLDNFSDLPPPSEYGDAELLVFPVFSLNELEYREFVNDLGAPLLAAGLPLEPPEPPLPPFPLELLPPPLPPLLPWPPPPPFLG